MNSNQTKSKLAIAVIFWGLISVRCASNPPQVAHEPYYLSDEAFDSLKLNPPAPLGSAKDKQDLHALKIAQQTRTEKDCKRAAEDGMPINPAYQEFFGSISPIPTPLEGEAREFIVRIWSDGSLVSEKFKKQFKWPRAYAVDDSIQPCLEKASSPSYPSGHALVSRLFALVLSEIDPQKRAIYLKRADEIAHDRLIAGMHRPSDLDAGKELADQMFQAFRKSKNFQKDLAAVSTLVSRK